MISGKAYAGHPVDVATGVEFLAEHDIEIDGVAPLIFRRAYSTAFLERPISVLGQGWVHQFEARLVRNNSGFEFEGHNGERIQFYNIEGAFEKTGSILSAGDFMELRREGSNLVVYHWHGIDEPHRYIFKPLDEECFRFIARELPSGQGLIVDYDAQGRVAIVKQNTEGRCLYFSYNQAGLLSEINLGADTIDFKPKQIVVRYIYDARQRLIAVHDALGNTHTYGYDDAGRLIYERNRRGGEYRMKYDRKGRCIETTGKNGYQSRRFKYNETAGITWVLDSFNNNIKYRYNAYGQILFMFLPDGAVYSTDYDELGRIILKKGPLGAEKRFEFDEQGNLAKKTHSNGGIQQFEYNEHHQLTKAIDPDGGAWQMRYERGALAERTDPAGGKTQFLRDERNNLIGIVGPSGNKISIRIDEAFTREDIEDSYGLIYARQLNLFLKPLEIFDAQGPVRSFVYDDLGRMIETIRPDNTRRQYAYDPKGSLIRMADGRGNVWSASYSAYGERLQQADPMGRVHDYTWDTEGRVNSIRNPKGELATLEYDNVGNLTVIKHFDGSEERMEHDLTGILVKRWKTGGTAIDFQRDEMGRIISIKSNSQELRGFTYNISGDIVAARAVGGNVTIEYEPGGRTLAETQNDRRIAYAYNKMGLPARCEFDKSKAGALLFEYDNRGQLIAFRAENEGEQSFKYDTAGRLTQRRMNATHEDYVYDSVGRIKQQRLSGIGTRTYQYDAEDALIEMVDTIRGRTCHYHYDAVEQLMSSIVEQSAQGNNTQAEAHRYEYDDNGNISVWDNIELLYAQGNHLEHRGDIKYQRDPNGNIVSRVENGAKTKYEWNALGELIKVIHPDGDETSFGYDAFGRRTFKKHKDKSTAYYWTGDDLLAEETSEKLKEYAIFSAWPMAMWEDGKIRHIVNSHHGMPLELIDDHGEIIWQGEYDDWGRLKNERGKTTCELRLQGQIYDEETGLHYNRYRYYAPELGQFISPDPIGLVGGTNRFRYAPNAINWVDTHGLECGKRGRHITDDEMQAAIDSIHEASFGPRGRGSVPQTLTVTPDGRIILSEIGRKPHPRAVATARRLFGDDVEIVDGSTRTNGPGPTGDHAEQRGGHHADEGLFGGIPPGTRQASSHYACPDCENYQNQHGINNVTGNASDHDGQVTRFPLGDT